MTSLIQAPFRFFVLGFVFTLTNLQVYGQCQVVSTHWPGATFAPGRIVLVVPPEGISASTLQTALDNWSYLNGRYVDCYGPTFDEIASTGEQINLDYTDLGMLDNKIVRGQTDIDGATYYPSNISFGRLAYVNMGINSAVTYPETITELIAHEIGHLQSLDDCRGCPRHSSVMVDDANVTTINDSTGLPGPTNCDIMWVVSAVTDYVCPLPSCFR